MSPTNGCPRSRSSNACFAHSPTSFHSLPRTKNTFNPHITLTEGYWSPWRDLVGQSSNAQVDDLLAGINIGIQRLREIMDGMIDVSMIDNDLLSLNLQLLSLSNLFGLLTRDFEQPLQERQHTREIKEFPGSDMWINADSERLF